MDKHLFIKQIDSEVRRLNRVKQLLLGMDDNTEATSNAPVLTKTGRKPMSAAGRLKRSQAQKARWAKIKAEEKKASKK